MNISNRIPLVALAFVVMLPFTSAQQNSTSLEVNFIKKALPPSSPEFQAELRERNAWRTFVSAQPRWSVTFNEASGMPHRAYGPGIPTTGGSLQERVSNFMGTELIRFGVDPSSLAVSYTHLRAHETVLDLVCRLLLEKKKREKKKKKKTHIIRHVTTGSMTKNEMSKSRSDGPTTDQLQTRVSPIRGDNATSEF